MSEKRSPEDFMAKDSLGDQLRQQGAHLAENEIRRLFHTAEKLRDFVPKVGVFGKTGVGKSSLCNALFGQDVAPVDDIEACTRKPDEYLISSGSGRGIRLVDVPGLAENRERDKEYQELYRSLLPKLDLFVWVVKADDRALSSDEEFFNEIAKPFLSSTPGVIAINQIDKIEPMRDWDEKGKKPGVEQRPNIERKQKQLEEKFRLWPHNVIPVSAKEGFNLAQLVSQLINALPNEKKLGTLRRFEHQYQSADAKQEAQKGFFRSLWESATEFLSEHSEEIKEISITVVTMMITRGRGRR